MTNPSLLEIGLFTLFVVLFIILRKDSATVERFSEAKLKTLSKDALIMLIVVFYSSSVTPNDIAIIYSILETAKANHLRIRDYHMLLLKKLPRHMEVTNWSFLQDLLPLIHNVQFICKSQIKADIKTFID